LFLMRTLKVLPHTFFDDERIFAADRAGAALPQAVALPWPARRLNSLGSD
jgi:hypothetical protein